LKRIFACLFVIFLLAFGVASAESAGGTTGVLDINRVMQESPKVKECQAQLSARGAELTKQLDAEKPNITAEEFRRKQEAAYKEFLALKKDLEQQIDDSIKQAAEQVAKEKKLSLIIYKNGVAYGGPDVTDDVIKKMQ